MIDFPSGYFQCRLDEESQPLTTFNMEFGRYCFQRGPQGLASTGDKFNHDTDHFFSSLVDFLIKQGDDLAVQGTSLEDLAEKLEITAKEAEAHNCTWSISKFSAGRPVNIISGFQVTLDPTGQNPPMIGPDPARVDKLIGMKPPTTVKEV